MTAVCRAAEIMAVFRGAAVGERALQIRSSVMPDDRSSQSADAGAAFRGRAGLPWMQPVDAWCWRACGWYAWCERLWGTLDRRSREVAPTNGAVGEGCDDHPGTLAYVGGVGQRGLMALRQSVAAHVCMRLLSCPSLSGPIRHSSGRWDIPVVGVATWTDGVSRPLVLPRRREPRLGPRLRGETSSTCG